MKLFLQIIWICIVCLSCTTAVHVQKDKDVAMYTYHTYAWVDTRKHQNDHEAKEWAYADITVRNTVNDALRETGWTEVTDREADVFISYDLLEKRSRESINQPLYSQPYSRMFYNPYRRGWTTVYYPSQFYGYKTYTVPIRKTVITVSIMDAKTDKLIWRGWTTRRMDDVRLTDEEISSGVRAIFKKFSINS